MVYVVQVPQPAASFFTSGGESGSFEGSEQPVDEQAVDEV